MHDNVVEKSENAIFLVGLMRVIGQADHAVGNKHNQKHGQAEYEQTRMYLDAGNSPQFDCDD